MTLFLYRNVLGILSLTYPSVMVCVLKLFQDLLSSTHRLPMCSNRPVLQTSDPLCLSSKVFSTRSQVGPSGLYRHESSRMSDLMSSTFPDFCLLVDFKIDTPLTWSVLEWEKGEKVGSRYFESVNTRSFCEEGFCERGFL